MAPDKRDMWGLQAKVCLLMVLVWAKTHMYTASRTLRTWASGEGEETFEVLVALQRGKVEGTTMREADRGEECAGGKAGGTQTGAAWGHLGGR